MSLRTSGGTDHVYMQTVGVPAYQFIQDPLDYGTRIHHTSIDSYDHLKAEDLRQAAIIMASRGSSNRMPCAPGGRAT